MLINKVNVMPVENLSIDDLTYSKLFLIREFLHLRNTKQAMRLVISSFPFDEIEKIERLASALSLEGSKSEQFNKILSDAINEYFRMLQME